MKAASSHATLILLRHGQSEFNRAGRFTGWTDVGLSPGGIEESREAARVLRDNGYDFDSCHTSVLRRAVATADIILGELGRGDVRVARSWRLNERHYGALQGLGPLAAIMKFGLRIRRTQSDYRCQPPPLRPGDPRFPGFDPLYSGLAPEDLPRSESLEDTYRRLLPYWEQTIVPELAAGSRVLVVAHKNSLRGIRKMLEKIGDIDVRGIKVPTCVPWIYHLDENLRVVDSFRLRRGAQSVEKGNDAAQQPLQQNALEKHR